MTPNTATLKGERARTPGPRTVSGLLDAGLDHERVTANGPRAIARVPVPALDPSCLDPRGEARANAQLIAAAPGLLAALKTVREILIRGDAINEFCNEITGSIDHIDRAISKAEGR
jgi:hypothetical protein